MSFVAWKLSEGVHPEATQKPLGCSTDQRASCRDEIRSFTNPGGYYELPDG